MSGLQYECKHTYTRQELHQKMDYSVSQQNKIKSIYKNNPCAKGRV